MGERGRRVRVAVTIVLVGLMLTGSAWGLDDDFPFAPMRMYASTRSLDSAVNDTWPYAVDETGREFRLSQALLGVRRAEIEGQLGRFRDDPSQLEILVDVYETRYPDAPELALVEIRTRKIQMSGGTPTGEESVLIRARWES
jgi:hypothetical protein